jgi:hypothetical protein
MRDIKLTYFSDVKEGKLQNNVRQRIANELQCFEGKRVEITIQRLKSTRSVQQNRLWWLYMNIISHELGYTKDECHEIFKYKLLKRERVDERTGEVFEYLGSTTKFNKTEFAELVNELIRYCAETLHIILPLPNTQLEIE